MLQGQFPEVVTLTLPLPPAALKVAVEAERAYAQEAAC
jgi:hypothetical protein